MTISLFQLSATAWLNPRMVGHAVQGTRNSQLPALAVWSQHLPDSMKVAGFDVRRVSRVGQVVRNLSEAVKSENYQRAYRAKEKLARLICGIETSNNTNQWQATVRWWNWEVTKTKQPSDSLKVKVEEAIRATQFFQSGLTIRPEYDQFNDVEKVALYAIAKKRVLELTERRGYYPTYGVFWSCVRVATFYSDLENISQMLDPHSTFNRFLTKTWKFRKLDYNFYELFPIFVHSCYFGSKPTKKLLNDLRELLCNRITVQIWMNMHAELLLYQPDEVEEWIPVFPMEREDPLIISWGLFVAEDPDLASRLFREDYHGYLEKPMVTGPYASLSETQRMAILSFVEDQYCESHRFASRIKNLTSFARLLEIECELAGRRKTPVSLRNFVEHLVREDPFSVGRYFQRYSPYLALNYILERQVATDSIMLRVEDIVFRRREEIVVSFARIIEGLPIYAPEQQLEAAVELLEEDFALTKKLFKKYASIPKEQRLAAKEQVNSRARELVHNPRTALKSLEDPFEVMAILRTLGDQAPELGTVLDILRESKVPPRSRATYYAPFQFEVRELPLPPHSAVSKLSLYAEKLLNLNHLDILMDEIKNVLNDFVRLGPVRVRSAPEIRGVLQRIDGLSLDWNLLEDGRSKFEENPEQMEEAVKILEEVLQFFSKMIRQRTLALMAHKQPDERGQIKQRVINEYADYFGRLLVAWSVHKYYWEDQYNPLRRYQKKYAMLSEDFRAFDKLAHFFGPQLQTAMSHFFKDENFPLPSQIKLRFRSKKGEYYDEDVSKEIEGMGQNKEKIDLKEKDSSKKVKVRLIPDVGALASFYGYMSDNCLAKADWAIHAMRDTGFVPYRIVVGDEWRGVVQTFTLFVTITGERRKFLIVSGIDPQPDLFMDPEGFLAGLEKGFDRIAAEGDYDWVVVPAKDFAQTSRRDFRREFQRYTIGLSIDQPVGFPQIGVEPDGTSLYYSNEEHGEAWHDEFSVFRSQKI